MATTDRTDSRYEKNQRVKQVLVRHGANLTLLKWSSSKTTAYFYGILKRDPDEDFTVPALEALVKDLAHMPHGPRIQFNLENWDISSDSGSWKFSKKKKPATMEGWAEAPRTVVIRKVEQPGDVLKDIGREETPDDDVPESKRRDRGKPGS